jgi:peptide/nickel transport system permease protein
MVERSRVGRGLRGRSGGKNRDAGQEAYFLATQWQLMGWKFRRHKLAVIGLGVLGVLYLLAFFCEVVAPYDTLHRHPQYVSAPPQRIRFFDRGHFQPRPFVYGYTSQIDMKTFQRVYVADPGRKFPLYFFVRGDEYAFWGLLKGRLHLFGVKGQGEGVFLFGTDALGRDLFSRSLYGARVSLTIGLVGVALSLVIGISLGGISGYYGGRVDDVIQRLIEFLRSIPTIPLWMGLSAALPIDWPIMRTYFFITIILSIVGWTGVARVVRSRIIALRGEDFVIAARVAGATDAHIIGAHLVPSFLSYIIVSVTLAIPNMILGETSLSFLGLGLRPPAVSWGVLLRDAQNMRTVAIYPWLMIPALLVILTVLAFNFVGDGLRDAADPYK